MTRTRTSRTTPRPSAPSIATAAALLAACGAALADGPICDPRLPYTMPDLDQGRTPGVGVLGLPNGGTQYCVPTCSMNIIKYLTNHGYPQLDPGSGPWLGTNAIYNQMTTAIQQLGAEMSTDPFGGTNGSNALVGLDEWIDDAGLDGVIVVTAKWVTPNDAPELGDLALAMLVDAPTSISVGWYSESPTGVLTRNGGHCVAVTRLPNFCGPNRQISIRDPGNGGSTVTQQPGTTETYSITTRNVTVLDNGSPLYTGPLERINNYSNGHIDGYRIFNPAFGIAACNNPVNGSCMTQFLPDVGFTTIPRTTHFDLPGHGIVDLDLLPSNLRMAAVVAGPTPTAPKQLFVADRAGGDPVPVPVPFSPERVATGEGENRLYVLDAAGAAVHVVDWKPDRYMLGAVSLPAPAAAHFIDDPNQQNVVLSATQRRVLRIDAHTNAVVSDLPLPPSVQLGPTPRIAVCPVGGYLWLTSGTPIATGLMSGAGGLTVAASLRTNDPNPPAFEGVATDDRGHLFTHAGGEVVEFAPPAAPGGQWQIVPESRFAEFRNLGIFKIARSRSNLVPQIHDAPDWTLNVLPTQFAVGVPDCSADWDGNGVVNSTDTAAFLASWTTSVSAHDLAADFNADGAVNSTDISAYLQAWLRDVQSGDC